MLSGGALGSSSIPDRVAMAGLAPKNGMALVSRLVWFTATPKAAAEVGAASKNRSRSCNNSDRLRVVIQDVAITLNDYWYVAA
jgi:hypothetical protein